MKPTLSRLPMHAAGIIAAGMLALPFAGGAAKADDQISIYFVGCAAPTGFHGYLARGAEEAGKNLGVKGGISVGDVTLEPVGFASVNIQAKNVPQTLFDFQHVQAEDDIEIKAPSP